MIFNLFVMNARDQSWVLFEISFDDRRRSSFLAALARKSFQVGAERKELSNQVYGDLAFSKVNYFQKYEGFRRFKVEQNKKQEKEKKPLVKFRQEYAIS